MNKPFVQIENKYFFKKAFGIKPLDGYEKPINKKTKKEFPLCCEFHEGVLKNITDHYNTFPNCCEAHKKLNSANWFKKEEYKYVIDKVVNQISYTEHCVQKHINDVDWYDAIVDYFEINIESFGQLLGGYGSPVGLSIYTFQVNHFLKQLDIPKYKKDKLIKFIDNDSEIVDVKNNKTDLNVLYNTYHKWLKIFPFELSIFSHLKEHFNKQLPFATGKPKVNRYSNIAKFQIHTKESLIEVLINITNNILTQINTSTLLEKGLIDDVNSLKLEFIINQRKLKLEQGYINNSKDEEQRYRNILKEWFNDEKTFIDEIAPLLNLYKSPKIETKIDLFRDNLTKHGFFELAKVKALSPNNQNKLVDLVQLKKLPYSIAMLDFLDFFTYLERKHFNSKYKLYKEVGKWFNTDKDGRAIKGNISVLLKNSTENKNRYTAFLHKETVQNDYQQLK